MFNLNGRHTPFSRQLTNQILRWICGIYFKNLNPLMQSEIINQWFKSRMYMLLLHFKSACIILSPTNVRDYADIYDLLYLPKHSTTAMAYIVFVHLSALSHFKIADIVLLRLEIYNFAMPRIPTGQSHKHIA